MLDPAAYPALTRLTAEQTRVWPDHAGYLAKSLTARSPAVLAASDVASDLAIKLSSHLNGGLSELCEDYKFVCQNMILEEELHFRRYHEYRLKTFAEAYNEYYSQPTLMKRYMNGLLLSNIFWVNHANALEYYLSNFLPASPYKFDHLEVGPGHGLLLYFAAKDPRAGNVTGWDVSEGSIAATRRALETIGVGNRVELICQDIFEASGAKPVFHNIVVSEVLEHLEDPLRAFLHGSRDHVPMRKNGRH